jgi:hypothetical protein
MTFESKLASLITSEIQSRTVNKGEVAEAMTLQGLFTPKPTQKPQEA